MRDHALDTILADATQAGSSGCGSTEASACICSREQHLAELTTLIHGGQCSISRYSPRPTRMNSSVSLPRLPSQCLAKKVLGVRGAQRTPAAMTSLALNGSRILPSHTARRISRMRYPSRFMTVSRSVVARRSRTLALWTASGSPALLQRDRWFTYHSSVRLHRAIAFGLGGAARRAETVQNRRLDPRRRDEMRLLTGESEP